MLPVLGTKAFMERPLPCPLNTPEQAPHVLGEHARAACALYRSVMCDHVGMCWAGRWPQAPQGVSRAHHTVPSLHPPAWPGEGLYPESGAHRRTAPGPMASRCREQPAAQTVSGWLGLL